MSNVVDTVVAKDLCSGCGVCAGVCPANALQMGLRQNGDLAPFAVSGDCARDCGTCLRVCPFSDGVHNPRKENERLFAGQGGAVFDENVGWHLECRAGFRADAALRHASASGGLATWLLETLLSRGLITRAAVVRLAEKRDKGFFEFRAAGSVSELRQAVGSVYHPVEISGILRDFPELRDYFAEGKEVIGVLSEADAVQKAKRLLGDSVGLQAIGQAAYARVLRDHKWEHRWALVLKEIAHHGN